MDQLRAIPYGKVVPNALIDGIVFELAKLPPSSVPWAGYRVAVWAGLWSDYDPRSRQTGCLFPFRRRQVTPLDWLKANPRLAPVFIFHHSGYLREAALQRLDRLPASPFFVAALFWRMNDWVPQVRASAVAETPRLLKSTSPAAIAGAAPYLLSRHLAWERWEMSAQDTLTHALCRDDVAKALAEHLCSSASGPIAKTMQLAMRVPTLDQALPRLSRTAVSPHVRRNAYEAMATGQVKWPIAKGRKTAPYLRTPKYEYESRRLSISFPLEEVIADAASDRSPIVRRGALDILIRKPTDLKPFLGLLNTLKSDPSPAVRQRSEFLIQKSKA
ncbi:hypothetical protein [Brevundimonas sp.]|uniref:hypothetical protein n=1 Tax=Brevundimonas sp. TaxID=1871086 RepID=UPI00351246DC